MTYTLVGAGLPSPYLPACASHYELYYKSMFLVFGGVGNWKYGSMEENEHRVSPNLPSFHLSAKPKLVWRTQPQ